MLHHQGRPSWWNMRWQRSMYQGRGREDVNIPPHPTPTQHTVNIASCCIIKVVPVGGTCVDNVVYIKDVVVRTFISHPTPYIYIYTKRKNVPKRTGHPSRREQLLNHRPITIITRQSVQRLHKHMATSKAPRMPRPRDFWVNAMASMSELARKKGTQNR